MGRSTRQMQAGAELVELISTEALKHGAAGVEDQSRRSTRRGLPMSAGRDARDAP
jgi:hypothetical protein